MIKFFRHIRQRMLNENRFSRYFLYGIGEIVLVVIGILIALQINNWNEAKKDQAYETKMLSEVAKALKADRLNCEDHVNAYTRLGDAVDHFTDLARNKVQFNDSMYPRFWELNIGRYLQSNRGPYEAIKSSGIDRISNDGLRNHLINFFDFELLVFHSNLEHSTRNYRPSVETLLSFLGDSHVDDHNNLVHGQIPSDVLQRPEFLRLIANIEWRANSANDDIEAFIPKMDALIQHIDTETDQ
jgi:hypothetical protein